MSESNENDFGTDSRIDIDFFVRLLRKHLFLFASTIIVCLFVSFLCVLTKPKIYTVETKLILLEFIQVQKKARIGSEGGYYRTSFNADGIKLLLLSKDFIDFLDDKYGGLVSVDFLPNSFTGVVHFRTSANSGNTATIAAQYILQELGKKAYAIGYLSTPAISTGNIRDVSTNSHASMLYLLDKPSKASLQRTGKFKFLLLSILSSFSFGVFMVLLVETFSKTNSNHSKAF